MAERVGSPDKPLKIRCTSIARPSKTCAYLTIVAEGKEYYFDLTFGIARLFSAQAAEVVAAWPAEEVAKAS